MVVDIGGGGCISVGGGGGGGGGGNYVKKKRIMEQVVEVWQFVQAGPEDMAFRPRLEEPDRDSDFFISK
jgi:hypothetical protein